MDQLLSQSPGLLPAIEQRHVHTVYDRIAPHFSHAKLKAWPRVKRFLLEQEPGALIADIGCGNGKYLHINNSAFKIGSDRCSAFVDIAAQPESARGDRDVMVCDSLALPYRHGCFDAAISIGVLHHLATVDRRVQALRELARILTVGGKVMIYVWAMEQTKRKFSAQDVLVPWHSPLESCKRKGKKSKKMSAKERQQLFLSSNLNSDEEFHHKLSRRSGRRPMLNGHVKNGKKVRSSKNKPTSHSATKNKSTADSIEIRREGNFAGNKENFKVARVCNSLLTFLGDWSPFSSSDSDLSSSTEALPAKVRSENHHEPGEFSRTADHQVSSKRSGSPITVEAIASKFDLFRALISSKFSKSTDDDNSAESSFTPPDNWNSSHGVNGQNHATKNGKKLKKVASSGDNMEIPAKKIHPRSNSLPTLSDQDPPTFHPIEHGFKVQSTQDLNDGGSRVDFSSESCVSTDDEDVSGEYFPVDYKEESRIASLVHQTCLEFDSEILSRYRVEHPAENYSLSTKNRNKQKYVTDELPVVADSTDEPRTTSQHFGSHRSPNGLRANGTVNLPVVADSSEEPRTTSQHFGSHRSPNGLRTNGGKLGLFDAARATHNHATTTDQHSGSTSNGVVQENSTGGELIVENSNRGNVSMPVMGSGNSQDTVSDSLCKRYYHVFREGELAELIESNVENLNILHSYYDHGNWCVVAEKVNVWKI